MIVPMYFVHSQNGDTALIRASERGRAAIVKVLLEHDAEVDLQNQVCVLLTCDGFIVSHVLVWVMLYS